jgi:hypothetical protein
VTGLIDSVSTGNSSKMLALFNLRHSLRHTVSAVGRPLLEVREKWRTPGCGGDFNADGTKCWALFVRSPPTMNGAGEPN